jgi:hypothetical protein
MKLFMICIFCIRMDSFSTVVSSFEEELQKRRNYKRRRLPHTHALPSGDDTSHIQGNKQDFNSSTIENIDTHRPIHQTSNSQRRNRKNSDETGSSRDYIDNYQHFGKKSPEMEALQTMEVLQTVQTAYDLLRVKAKSPKNKDSTKAAKGKGKKQKAKGKGKGRYSKSPKNYTTKHPEQSGNVTHSPISIHITKSPKGYKDKYSKKNKSKGKKNKTPKTKSDKGKGKGKKSAQCFTLYSSKGKGKKSKKKSVPCSGTFDPTSSPTRQPNSPPIVVTTNPPTKSPAPTKCDDLDCPRPSRPTDNKTTPVPTPAPIQKPGTTKPIKTSAPQKKTEKTAAPQKIKNNQPTARPMKSRDPTPLPTKQLAGPPSTKAPQPTGEPTPCTDDLECEIRPTNPTDGGSQRVDRRLGNVQKVKKIK